MREPQTARCLTRTTDGEITDTQHWFRQSHGPGTAQRKHAVTELRTDSVQKRQWQKQQPYTFSDNTLALAEGLGVGTRDLKRIEVVGTPIAKGQFNFRKV